ncbi:MULTISPECIES: multiubiquitin domain-containing protein [Mesorhizobium]|uniref:Multi-ubiquitin domain-containing protein n=1 Tax=Rhizobium loti TaxID=381 RepID=M5AN70_RHILI|nr:MULTISPECIES: multiubiquitin domain-containing protein [Mesorhizobium]ANN60694.1 hypothetical protein A9174_30975 [Mesorhizobium loti NZP2037]OBP81295.1 hypothetical protein BAE41_06110 [Mesorhizobium loti]OBP88377.1 hypothetical protein BAE38_14300 [Mesorhizobium loti]OBQ69336.1 hypothetical protein A9K72_14400 [Mesorhizobium loti]BAN09975.1 conserved hypothetical protein [Mesorhizobium loti NZP2037]
MSDDDEKDVKDKKSYKVQIDKEHYESNKAQPTARELLVLAGKSPPEHFALYFKPKRGAPERIEIDKEVDLREPGVERFVTLPLDQTEGLGTDRREFDLPAEDVEWLVATGLRYELVREGGVLRVVIYGYPVPPGYNVSAVDVNVRIDTGYPEAQIDMAYFYPELQRGDGRSIGALAAESFDGKVWQRWSRHRTPANPWRPGVDNLSTHFGLVDSWLSRELAKA